MLIKTNKTQSRRNLIIAAAVVALVRAHLSGLTLASLGSQPQRIALAALATTMTWLAAMALRRLAGLVFQRPWYANLPAMVLLAVAVKSIVRSVQCSAEAICRSLQWPRAMVGDQIALLTIALTLTWVVLLDRTMSPKSMSLRRRGGSMRASARLGDLRDTIWHPIRSIKRR